MLDHQMDVDENAATRRAQKAVDARDFIEAVLKPMCPDVQWNIGEVYDADNEAWATTINGITVYLDSGAKNALYQYVEQVRMMLTDIGDVLKAMK